MAVLEGEPLLSTKKTIANNIKAIQTGISLLENLTDSEYNHLADPYFTASPGKHFRHILDHYNCFIDGLKERHIDYDSRCRVSQIETDIQSAIKASNRIIDQLKTLEFILINEQKHAERTIQVTNCTSVESGTTAPVESSLERELIFLHSHTTHHFSIIGAILKLQNHRVDPDFGVAPSTLAYEEKEQSQKQCAP